MQAPSTSEASVIRSSPPAMTPLQSFSNRSVVVVAGLVMSAAMPTSALHKLEPQTLAPLMLTSTTQPSKPLASIPLASLPRPSPVVVASQDAQPAMSSPLAPPLLPTAQAMPVTSTSPTTPQSIPSASAPLRSLPNPSVVVVVHQPPVMETPSAWGPSQQQLPTAACPSFNPAMSLSPTPKT